MLKTLEIIINGQYSLYLPFEGVNLTLVNNEFDVLTNDSTSMRPLSVLQTFEIPLTPNIAIFKKLEGVSKYAEVKYNGFTVMEGLINEYSADEQTKTILITVTTGFKEVVDFMGDNVFNLDSVDLSRYNAVWEGVGWYNLLTNSRIDDINKVSPSGIERTLVSSIYGNVVQMRRIAGKGEYQITLDFPEKDATVGVDVIYYAIIKPVSGASWFFGGWNSTYAALNNNSPFEELSDGWRLYWAKVRASSAFIGAFGLNSIDGTFQVFGFGVQYNTTPPPFWTGNTTPVLPPRIEGMKYIGEYNPMDTTTGRIVYDAENVADYCAPSLGVLPYLREVFEQAGWSANWDAVEPIWGKLALLPTSPFSVSSFGFRLNGAYSVPANGSISLPLDSESLWYNLKGGGEFSGSQSFQPRSPARNMSFKIRATKAVSEPCYLSLKEGDNEIGYIDISALEKVNFVTDIINTLEGIDALSIELINPNNYAIDIAFDTFDFYNLVTIYETTQDPYLSPVGYMFPVADNVPAITPLELYREIMVLFQIAQTADNRNKSVEFYFLNDIFKGTPIDINQYLLWDGYVTLSDQIEGLSKLNAIRYNSDLKKQQYFRINLNSLPASGVYFESIFAPTHHSKEWDAGIVPALQYKVKTVDEIAYEYLEWYDVSPQIAYYTESGKMQALTIQMPQLIQNYWGELLKQLSSTTKSEPTVFELRLNLSYWEYALIMRQRNLFYYTTDAILLSGQYNIIEQIFTGVFLALR